MPRLTPVSAAIVVRSLPPQAATAWARLEQPRSVRAGRRLSSDAAREIRCRYAVRLARLRSVTRAVTSATTGWRAGLGGVGGTAVVSAGAMRLLGCRRSGNGTARTATL